MSVNLHKILFFNTITCPKTRPERRKSRADACKYCNQPMTIIENFLSELFFTCVYPGTARAGDAGSGFAVAADGVRNLSIRTAQSADHTQELLNAKIKKISRAEKLIKMINDNFSGIIKSATAMDGKTDKITQISVVIYKGIGQFSKAASEVEASSQVISAGSEESPAYSENLLSFSKQMECFVDDLNEMTGDA